MIRLKQTQLLLLFLLLMAGVAHAQNNTNSPYTRYGYGQLTDPGSGNSKAMGGVAYALRDKYHVNFANPASYSAVDSLTFMFDGGIGFQNTNFSNGQVKMNVHNSSIDYLTMQFRAAKWCGISLGVLPYSNVGYSFGEYQEDENYPNNSTTVTYSGEGGLHQVYLGAGFKIFKNLSVGANVSYLWGDITRTRAQSFTANSSANGQTTTMNLAVRSYKLDFGLQYTQQLAKNHQLTLGAVFSPGHDLKNTSYVQDVLGSSSSTASVVVKDTAATYGIPTTFGAGIAYTYADRLTIAADVAIEKWADVKYMNASDVFCDRSRIALGAEYVPNPLGRNYLSHVKYRMGAYYSNPYYKIDGERAAKEYGLSAGFGLPIPRTRSVLSLTAQYVKIQGNQASFLDENTLRICVGFTFNERWFFKSKVY